MRKTISLRMPDAGAVAPSGTSIFKLPIGRAYHGLQLITVSGTTPLLTDVGEIRVIANEKIIHRYNGTERDMMNQFDGRAAWHATTNKILPIPFMRYNLENSALMELTAVDTGPVTEGEGRKIRSLTVEIDWAAGMDTNMVYHLHATQSASTGQGAGTILHVLKDSRDIQGAGERQFSDLPFNSVTAQVLNRVFLTPSANAITDVEVKRANNTVFERSAELNSHLQVDGIRTPQTGVFVIDRTENGFGGDGIDLIGVDDFRYVVDADGAMTVGILSEYLGALGD